MKLIEIIIFKMMNIKLVKLHAETINWKSTCIFIQTGFLTFFCMVSLKRSFS
jgi:hypothetical protein